ncbi:hemerythrin [Lachnospiraceae bacterium KM106-2]|nr:hemerythrin [Lachnospiraceae bacterium KM106-2]
MPVMKQEYYTGIERIDEEHKLLFEIAGEAIDLLNNEFISDKYDNFVAIIDELILYSKNHFAHEEAYMEKIQYERLYSQKLDHKKFILMLEMLDPNKLDEEESQEALLKELVDLISWLVSHIVIKDKMIPNVEK